MSSLHQSSRQLPGAPGCLGWAVGPVTWGGLVLVRGSLWLWPGCSGRAAGQGKTQPLPSGFLPPSSPAEPRRSGCPEIPRPNSKKPELANDHFNYPTAASATGHTLWPVVGCQGGLSTEVGGAAAACSSRSAGGLQGASYHPPALLWALLMLSSSLLAPCLS